MHVCDLQLSADRGKFLHNLLSKLFKRLDVPTIGPHRLGSSPIIYTPILCERGTFGFFTSTLLKTPFHFATCGAKMSLTLNSPIWDVIGSNLHTTSDACTSSLPNMEGVTNNTPPNSFELKDNSNVAKKLSKLGIML